MIKILVIDDDATIRGIVRTALERHGCVVAEAKDGRDGIKQIKAEPPALALIDLIMPEQEGMETIQKLRRDFPAIKIIAISGGGQMGKDDLLYVAKKLGADGCLAKPFTTDALWSEVQKALAGKQGQKAAPDSHTHH